MRNLDALLKTLDGFYAAAFGERSWRSSMEDMRLLLGASRVCLVDAGVPGWRTVSNERDDDPRFSAPDGFQLYLTDPIAGAERAVPTGTVYAWREITDIAALKRRALWGDFYGPMGLHEALSCRLGQRNESIYVFHATRQERQSAFDRDERRALGHLLPHLTRAGTLGSDQGQAWGDRGEAVSAGRMVVDGHGRVEWCDAASEALLATGRPLLIRHGRLRAAARADAAGLERLLAGVCRDADIPQAGGSLVMGGADGDPAPLRYLVEVCPLREASAFGMPAVKRATVTIRSLAPAPAAPDPARLRGALGLTGAEASLAAELAAGRSLRDAATRCGVTFGTARNYLLQIFRKTGTRRQADLVSLARTLLG